MLPVDNSGKCINNETIIKGSRLYFKVQFLLLASAVGYSEMYDVGYYAQGNYLAT